MSTHKHYPRVTLKHRKGDQLSKHDAEIFKSGGENRSVTFLEPEYFLPMFSSFLGVTISLYTISFYAEWKYLETTGLYLALAPIFIGFFMSTFLYGYYGHLRTKEAIQKGNDEKEDLLETDRESANYCRMCRKSWIPILFHLAGIVAIVLICLRLNGVLQQCDWAVLFTPLYVMDLLMASFIIKPSRKECWQRPLVAFITWASGSIFLGLLALQLDNKVDFSPVVLFIPMYINVVVLIPYLLYWFNSGNARVGRGMTLLAISSISPTILMIVHRLSSVWTLSWPVCMSPLMIFTTIGIILLLVLKVVSRNYEIYLDINFQIGKTNPPYIDISIEKMKSFDKAGLRFRNLFLHSLSYAKKILLNPH